MAAKDNESLIGYDPLAWMNEEGKNEMPENIRNDHGGSTGSDAEQKQKDIPQDLEVSEPGIETEKTLSEPAAAKEVVVLDSILNIQNVAGLYNRLLQMLQVNDKIEFDASNVAAIDTATLQLLIILKQQAIKLGKEIVFDFPSDHFIEAAGLLGLAQMLGLDKPESGLF